MLTTGLAAPLAACYHGTDFPNAGALGGDPTDDTGHTGGASQGDPTPEDDDVEAQCGEPAPGASPLRRLTGWEWNNTVADLFGTDNLPAVAFPEEGGSGFDNNADVSSATRLLANKYMLASEVVATHVVADLGSLLSCDPSDSETECVRAWIARFGRKTWRRPLSDDELTELTVFFSDARALGDLPSAVAAVLERMLQSPHFLYRIELIDDAMPAQAVALDGWQIATRLSYFLWGSMPDDALFAAAAADELHTIEEVESQAKRMLLHPKARRAISHFHEQWLGYQRLATIDKDTTVFPNWSSEIAAKQRVEANAFVEHVLLEGDGKLSTLLSAPFTIVDSELANFYGITLPPESDFTKVEPLGRDVAGVLTLGGVLSAYSKPNATNPIARGLFVREQLLCTLPPPPPDDVEFEPPPDDPNATTRELLEEHRSNPVCAACHALFDEIGLGLEQFDAVGRWRTHERELEIDVSGVLAATDVDGPFDGAGQLAERLARSSDVARCMTRQWFRYAYGRTEHAEADACNLDLIDEAFSGSEYDVRELLVALTLTDAFRFRAAAEATGGE